MKQFKRRCWIFPLAVILVCAAIAIQAFVSSDQALSRDLERLGIVYGRQITVEFLLSQAGVFRRGRCGVQQRDQHETEPEPPKSSLSPLQIQRRVKVAWGKSTEQIDAKIARQSVILLQTAGPGAIENP